MIYKNFEPDDIAFGKPKQVSSGFFNGAYAVTQSLFYTSSQANIFTGSDNLDIKNGQYYVNVYNNNESFFSIAYGSPTNSGSSAFDSGLPIYGYGQRSYVFANESRVVYSTYRNLLLPPNQRDFLFADYYGKNTVNLRPGRNIVVFNFNSYKIKDQIDPGQWQINFKADPDFDGTTWKNTNGASGVPPFASGYGDKSYIDDSCIVKREQDYYNIISGSIVNGVPVPYLRNGAPVYISFPDIPSAGLGGFGMVYPKHGIVLFNEAALGSHVGLLLEDAHSGRGSDPKKSNSYNNEQLAYLFGDPIYTFNKHWRGYIQRIVWPSIKKSNKPMIVRKSEFVPSKVFYVRVKSKEFNYSYNPTFISDGKDGKTVGEIKNSYFVKNPTTYITSVGLYNDKNELVAIGKLSKPIKKTPNNEILMKVRVDF